MKLDLQDAYFFVPIHKSTTVCFPRNNIRVPMPIIGDIQYLHEIYKTVEICHILLLKQEIQFLIYVKNMLIVGQRPERLSAIFQSVVYRLQRLGFFIKLGKWLKFLGSLINSKYKLYQTRKSKTNK